MTFTPAPWPRKLRSQEWFGGTSKDAIYHRSWMKNQGLPADLFDGRPVIGICNTWSQLTPCNAHLRDLAEKVAHGIYEAGGLPMEFPVMSPSESAFRPTAMMFRNLCAMDVEECLRGQPIDGVVLLAGCDKTTPALIMGAASVDIPAILVSGGPMLNGYFRGERVGSGTHLWKFSEAVKAGEMTAEEFVEAEASMSRSAGACNTMGTASTMASMAEALGMALSGNAAIPAVDSRRRVMAHLTGRRIVQMVKDDLKPSDILTRDAFENAMRVNGAIGGSTNAVIHILAMAGRVGLDLTLEDWDRCGRDVPTIVNLMPSGKYLMEEFFYAGGLPVVIQRLGEAGLLHKDALTVSGETMWDQVKDVVNHNADVILPADKALEFYYPLSQNYFIVYDANAGKIGQVKDGQVRETIVVCYNKCKKVVDGLKYNNELYRDYQNLVIMDEGDRTQIRIDAKFKELVAYGHIIKEDHLELKSYVEHFLRLLNVSLEPEAVH